MSDVISIQQTSPEVLLVTFQRKQAYIERNKDGNFYFKLKVIPVPSVPSVPSPKKKHGLNWFANQAAEFFEKEWGFELPYNEGYRVSGLNSGTKKGFLVAHISNKRWAKEKIEKLRQEQGLNIVLVIYKPTMTLENFLDKCAATLPETLSE